MSTDTAAVDLYWLPLGAGGHSVRVNGLVFETLSAAFDHRPRCDLYHSALAVRVPDAAYTIEMTPVRSCLDSNREVVASGAVGSAVARRLRIFRYEVVRWRDGTIPDVAEAVDSPRRLSSDRETAQRVLDLAPVVPTPVWGRDELHAGEMWNSNSIVSWLIASSAIDTQAIAPPARGRAPGWSAGLVIACRRPAVTV
jgi:hypothetical protein